MLFLAFGLLCGRAVASADAGLSALEEKVWNADEHEFPALERTVVRIIQITPTSELAHYLLSHLYLRMYLQEPSDLSLLKMASDVAQQTVELNPRQDLGFVALANILDAMGQGAKGIQLLDQSKSLGVTASWRMLYTRARLSSDVQDPAKSEEELYTALMTSGSSKEIILPFVLALLQSRFQGEELVEHLASWQKRIPHPMIVQSTATAYADMQMYHKAHELYQALYSKDKSLIEARINDAVIEYKYLNHGTQAIAMLEDVLTSKATALRGPVESTLRAHLGAAYLCAQKDDKAADMFVSAMRHTTSSAGMTEFIAKTYRERKKFGALVKLLDTMNDSIPGKGLLYALKGETLTEELKDHDLAIKAYADAIVLEPNRSEYYNGMGLTYYRMNRFPEALRLFGAATKINPADASARYNEACVLARTGKADDALAALKAAVSLDPRLGEHAKTDADFASIKPTSQFIDIVENTRPAAPLVTFGEDAPTVLDPNGEAASSLSH